MNLYKSDILDLWTLRVLVDFGRKDAVFYYDAYSGIEGDVTREICLHRTSWGLHGRWVK